MFSLSGRYMTWHEMEQELNGLPGKMMVQSVREQRVNLFVPAYVFQGFVLVVGAHGIFQGTTMLKVSISRQRHNVHYTLH